MSWTPDEAAQIGRIEAKLDMLSDVERRVDKLEQFRAYVKGVAAVLLAGGGIGASLTSLFKGGSP